MRLEGVFCEREAGPKTVRAAVVFSAAEAMTQRRSEAAAGTHLDLRWSRPEKNHAGAEFFFQLKIYWPEKCCRPVGNHSFPQRDLAALAGSQRGREATSETAVPPRLALLEALVSSWFSSEHVGPRGRVCASAGRS